MLEAVTNYFTEFAAYDLATKIRIVTFVLMLGAPFFWGVLERKFPYRKGLKFWRKSFWLDFFWYTMFQSYLLGILIFDFIIAPAEHWFGIAEQGYISHWPLWALVLFFLFTHDLYIYWFHRLQHTSKIFWRTHEAHHSCTEVDWVAGSRSHVLEIIINQTIEFAPIIFLLDVETAALLVPIKGFIDAWWGMWIHSNVNAKTGKLQYVINGPEMHQWHHADHKEVFFANYATKFAFWDWIFGTAYLPSLQKTGYNFSLMKPVKYGLPYKYPHEWILQNVYSVFRFNYEKIEHTRVMRWYINLWPSLLRGLGIKQVDAVDFDEQIESSIEEHAPLATKKATAQNTVY